MNPYFFGMAQIPHLPLLKVDQMADSCRVCIPARRAYHFRIAS